MDIEETIRAAFAGDTNAIRRLHRWLSGLSPDDAAYDRLIKKLKQPLAETDDEREEAEFRAELLDLKNTINSTPATSARALDALAERARRLGTCEAVQVLGLTSHRHRLLGDQDGAQDNLHSAWRLAAKCRHVQSDLNPCELDLYRRQGLLDGALGLLHPTRDGLKEGLRKVEIALDGYRRLEGPGHDINRDGVASCLYARAEIRFELGDFTGAAADLSTCLNRFPVTSKVWSRAQQDLATVLLHTGEEGRRQAYAILRRQRLSMRSRENCVEKATFLWVNGQLAVVLREAKAQKKLRDALDGFDGLGMPYHFIGVAHDIARSKLPRADKIKSFLDEIRPSAQRLISDRRHKELFNEIYQLAARCPTRRTWPRLDDALRQLRELAAREVPLPPCLLTA